ncbi:amidohydrolase family protein [Streptomyces sp. NPDC052077]|uniref:amidohydrolase family protein n=1 Tax=Streptomyces sp. NPDC052077 TaxID=3154757 RepID=UPI00343185B9
MSTLPGDRRADCPPGPAAAPPTEVRDQAPGTVDLLVRGAELVVTMAGEDIPGGWVAADGGMVAAVGPPGSEPPARRVLDASGTLVTPGLVNAHHHLFQNLTRAFAPAAAEGLSGWLGVLRPLWRRLDEEAAHVSTWVGLAELARNGCTTTADHLYLHPRPRLVDAQVAAAREVGLRFHPVRGSVVARPGADRDEVPSWAERPDDVLADSARLLDAFHDRSAGAMTRVAMGPTALAATTPALLEDLARLAGRHDARLHTHLFEEPGEAEECRAWFGRPPGRLLADSGWGGRAWVAHAVHPGEEGVRDLAAAGIGVAHCPSSNALLGAGIAPLSTLRAAGVTVGLGTDGSASADSASLWLEARTAMLLARATGGAPAMSGRQALALATVGAARCLGREEEIGALGPGMCADIAVWELDEVMFAGAHTDLVEAWPRCGPPRVRHTLVGGVPVVRDGELCAPGLPARLASHRAIARAWQHAAPV